MTTTPDTYTRKVLALQMLRAHNDAEVSRTHLNRGITTVDTTIRIARELETANEVLRVLTRIWETLFSDVPSLPVLIEASDS